MQALLALVKQRPQDAWSRREYALVLCDLRQYDQAAAEAAIAMRLEPNSPISHATQGLVFSRLDRLPEAHQCWRQSIRLSVDYQFAVNELVSSFQSVADRREALRFVRSELVRQVIFGNGLLAYRDRATGTLTSEELLEDLRDALAARPDLWHSWSAVINQLLFIDRPDEALKLAPPGNRTVCLDSKHLVGFGPCLQAARRPPRRNRCLEQGSANFARLVHRLS